MPDVASAKLGGQVLMVSSLDEGHPGNNVIDGSEHTFWISTGLYPQEILIRLGQPSRVSSVRLSSTAVRSVRIEGCHEETPVNFTTLGEMDLEDVRGQQLQVRTQPCAEHRLPLEFVRLVILSGWHDFCSVHRVLLEGVPAPQGRVSPRSLSRRPSGTDLASRRRASKESRGELGDQPASNLEIDIPPRASHKELAGDEPLAPRVPAHESAWQQAQRG